MGLNFLTSNSSFDGGSSNPDPSKYDILRNKIVNGYLVIEIKYQDCINYEGRKIMIFECGLYDLKKQKLIDPHFSDNSEYLSPIARFEPTERGWKNACLFAGVLPSNKPEEVWVCNECNFENFTNSVSEEEIALELHACIHCGSFEFHKIIKNE
jgi:hypothetical protein